MYNPRSGNKEHPLIPGSDLSVGLLWGQWLRGMCVPAQPECALGKSECLKSKKVSKGLAFGPTVLSRPLSVIGITR